APAKFC
nr:Chain C, ZDC-ALA-PRO-ALA-LYS-PHE-CYS-ALA-PRO-ALA-PHB-GAL [synthetic construct]